MQGIRREAPAKRFTTAAANQPIGSLRRRTLNYLHYLHTMSNNTRETLTQLYFSLWSDTTSNTQLFVLSEAGSC